MAKFKTEIKITSLYNTISGNKIKIKKKIGFERLKILRKLKCLVFHEEFSTTVIQ